jgi:homoserine kinase
MSGVARTWPGDPVTVRVPATSANLGPGFDSLGLALSLHDEVSAQVTDGGLLIDVAGSGEGTAGFGEAHLVVQAMRAAFGLLGEQPPGISLRCVNAIPHGFGLGSSAAAIVAGILAARALGGDGAAWLPDQVVLGLAAEMEGHADNVAACLAGGLVIAWMPERHDGAVPAESGARAAAAGAGLAQCVRLDPLPGLTPVLCVPAAPLATEAARQVLPPDVPLADAARNAARSALLIAALTGAASPELLLEATEDFLHQPYRATSMPDTAALITDLRRARVPAVVSGAGPAVLALVAPGVTPGAGEVAAIAAASGQDWNVSALDVDRCGATVRRDRLAELLDSRSHAAAVIRPTTSARSAAGSTFAAAMMASAALSPWSMIPIRKCSAERAGS